MENDGLNVAQFSSTSNSTNPVKINKIYGPTLKKMVSKKTVKLKVNRLAAVLGAVAIFGVFMQANYENANPNVEHWGEGANFGHLEHNHNLDIKYFIQDYKAINPKATKEDVMNAIVVDGAFETYRTSNGRIEKIGALQEEHEDEYEFYKSVCQPFAEEVMEAYSFLEETETISFKK